MTVLLRAADRFRTDQPGITTRHCFSAGPHYDPHRLGVGALVGVDEHEVAPDAGFDWHAHRGVQIVSWVIAGVLAHDDRDGGARLVGPGSLLVQSAGGGISHRETNASGTEPLRFVQLTLVGDRAAPVQVVVPPAQVGSTSIELRSGVDLRSGIDLRAGISGLEGLAAGDLVIDGRTVVLALDDGQLLVVRVGA